MQLDLKIIVLLTIAIVTLWKNIAIIKVTTIYDGLIKNKWDNIGSNNSNSYINKKENNYDGMIKNNQVYERKIIVRAHWINNSYPFIKINSTSFIYE